MILSDEAPVLEEFSDDDEDTTPLKVHKSDACSSGKSKSDRDQTEAATKARWSSKSEETKSTGSSS